MNDSFKPMFPVLILAISAFAAITAITSLLLSFQTLRAQGQLKASFKQNEQSIKDSSSTLLELSAKQTAQNERLNKTETSQITLQTQLTSSSQTITSLKNAITNLQTVMETAKNDSKEWHMDYVRSLMKVETKIESTDKQMKQHNDIAIMQIDGTAHKVAELQQNAAELKREIIQVKKNINDLVEGLSIRPNITIDKSVLHPALLNNQQKDPAIKDLLP